MTSRVRWGVMGTGTIARKQVADMLAIGADVVAVGSRSIVTAADFARDFGIARTHGSYAELTADAEVDVVYVATPVTEHHANARLALEAGKHVLLEKPFTVTEAEAQDLADLAAARGLLLMEAHWTRFLPHMTRIHEIIAAGTIGSVRAVIADTGQMISDRSHWLHHPERGGGSLLDIGIYPVALGFDLFGEPTSVFATSALSDTGVDLQTSVVMTFAGGQHLYGHSSIEATGPNRASILGTLGRIEVETTWYAPTSFTVLDGANQPIERYENAVRPRGMQFQVAEFQALVNAGERASERMPVEESVAIMRTMEELRRQAGIRFPGE